MEEQAAIRLPPLIVEQTFHGGTWRYTEVPGFEILSRCNDHTTTQLVTAFVHAQDLLKVLLPERFQLQFDAPQALILYDDKLWISATKEATELLLQRGFSITAPAPRAEQNEDRSSIAPFPWFDGPASDRSAKAPAASRYFANLRLTDADTTTSFAVVSRALLDPRETFLTARYVGQNLGARRPALSRWFTAGFLAFYQNVTFQETGLVLARLPNDDPQQPLIPLAEFLSPKDQPAPALGALWLTEAELFVRWCLDPQMKSSEALWRFLDESPRAENLDTVFTRCFGLTPSEATRQLENYRARASGGIAKWKLNAATSPPGLHIRDATWSEVARIKGEWERLVARYVRKELPAFESIYLNQSRQSLRRAYDRGDRDGRLLASLGLLELEDGQVELARELLEAAAAKSVIRPRVYFECAKFRYDEELGRVRRADGKLAAEQIGRILEPLLGARRQAPPLAQVYELIADAWTNSADAPQASDLAIIDEGVSLFPESVELTSRAAALHHRLAGTQPDSPVPPLKP